MTTKNIQDVVSERLDTFTTELMHRARYVQGNKYKGNKYKEGSDEYKAYQSGFDRALAMVYIDLTGTPKTEGILTQLVKEVEAVERERVNGELVKEFKETLIDIGITNEALRGCVTTNQINEAFDTFCASTHEALTPTSDVTEK